MHPSYYFRASLSVFLYFFELVLRGISRLINDIHTSNLKKYRLICKLEIQYRQQSIPVRIRNQNLLNFYPLFVPINVTRNVTRTRTRTSFFELTRLLYVSVHRFQIISVYFTFPYTIFKSYPYSFITLYVFGYGNCTEYGFRTCTSGYGSMQLDS